MLYIPPISFVIIMPCFSLICSTIFSGNSSTSRYSFNSNFIAVAGTLGTYYYKLTNLNSSTRYYYAAYAIKAGGISYGPIKSFTTKKDRILPIIIGSTLVASSSYIDVNMSEYVYGLNKTVLTLSKFRCTFLANGRYSHIQESSTW